MVKVHGRMSVNIIQGRHGPFRVATLYSEIGDFVVRYEGLDQFEAGTYEGEFLVRDTDVLVRPFGVGKIMEPVAFLDDLTLHDADEGLEESVPEAIPDPISEEKPKRFTPCPVNLAGKPSSELTEVELKKLFGEVWPLADQVRLDPTVGRQILRTQATHLKSIGYKYNAKEQIWIKRH